MLVVVGALLLPLPPPPPPPLGEVFGVGDQRTTSNYWVEQSISAHVNILASTIVLHTLLPLSLTFTEEKANVKGIPKGISTIKPKKQTCIQWLLRCALKQKLYCVDCPKA